MKNSKYPITIFSRSIIYFVDDITCMIVIHEQINFDKLKSVLVRKLYFAASYCCTLIIVILERAFACFVKSKKNLSSYTETLELARVWSSTPKCTTTAQLKLSTWSCLWKERNENTTWKWRCFIRERSGAVQSPDYPNKLIKSLGYVCR